MEWTLCLAYAALDYTGSRPFIPTARCLRSYHLRATSVIRPVFSPSLSRASPKWHLTCIFFHVHRVLARQSFSVTTLPLQECFNFSNPKSRSKTLHCSFFFLFSMSPRAFRWLAKLASSSYTSSSYKDLWEGRQSTDERTSLPAHFPSVNKRFLPGTLTLRSSRCIMASWSTRCG